MNWKIISKLIKLNKNGHETWFSCTFSKHTVQSLSFNFRLHHVHMKRGFRPGISC